MRGSPKWRGVLGALAVTLGCLGSAQAVSVTASAGSAEVTAPADAAVGLSAVADDAPQPNDEVQVLSCVWSWAVVSVDHVTGDVCGDGSPSSAANWHVDQPSPSTPAATLVGSGLAVGSYKVALLCTVTYILSDGGVVSGSAPSTAVANVESP